MNCWKAWDSDMNSFVGMEDLLHDFLIESSELLSGVDEKLIELDKSPRDTALLNDIFRGFHTIKGGAGFLNAQELVALCHLTENLFDKLRNGELQLTPGLLDIILASTAQVKRMFDELAAGSQPRPAPGTLLAQLQSALEGGKVIDWQKLYNGLLGFEEAPASRSSEAKQVDMERLKISAFGRRADDIPGNKAPVAARRESDSPVRDNTIRVDINRLDQVLNLSGEIGLTKNRLTHLRNDILRGNTDPGLLKSLDESVSQLDMLVVNLQNAVMNTRMQPIGRLFRKYPRLVRDLARQLDKDVELILTGEETEIDKTMIEDLNDPLVHLLRNAVDHGVESLEERAAAGKPSRSTIHLSACQEGDHIVISITDDGKGMRPEVIRSKAVEKGLLPAEEASLLDDEQSLNLIFMPGFSTRDEISSVSGRGVGMDVVKTNIQKLNGSITIKSEPGQGTTFHISLPLTLAILPVLLLRLNDQLMAVPLSMVREIISVKADEQQLIGGMPNLVVRGEVLPMQPLAQLIGWEDTGQSDVGVLMTVDKRSFILTADGFAGHADVVVKPLETFKPRGVVGVTMSSDGEIVLILDVKDLITCTNPLYRKETNGSSG
jgi:two-component system chemotaxis sensor kinase CheA